MREHPEPANKGVRDEDYDREEAMVEGYNANEAKEDGRLPIADHESFADPDFDDEWNAVDEEEDSEFIDENQLEMDSKDFDLSENQNANSDTEDDWEVI